MTTPRFLMVELLSAVYWFDEALSAGLKRRGWAEVSRAQSMVLLNIASGVHRASNLARNLGVSRQAISQMLSEMEARGLVVIGPDENDRRAQVVNFSQESASIRVDAMRILRQIEDELAARIGKRRLAAMRESLAQDWGRPLIDMDFGGEEPSAAAQAFSARGRKPGRGITPT